ncbi:hypothetical protein, partial [Klebsiella pneumoniae]|uniref:hypothetical protein n=1 Tax=Klebsiella pneumoniae TaxID=573 RepID=UPI0011589F76
MTNDEGKKRNCESAKRRVILICRFFNSPLSALTQGCIVVMRHIRLCIISLLATLPLAVQASPQPL